MGFEKLIAYRAFTPDHGHRPGLWYWRPESYDPAEFLSPYENGYATPAEAVDAAAAFREARLGAARRDVRQPSVCETVFALGFNPRAFSGVA